MVRSQLAFCLPLALMVLGGNGSLEACLSDTWQLPQESSWVDDVQWLQRSDGSTSLVVEGLDPRAAIATWGLQAGDRVVSFAGAIPDSVDDLRQLAEQLSATDWQLTVLRRDRLVRLAVPPPLEEELLEEVPAVPDAGGVEYLPLDDQVGEPAIHSLDTWAYGFEIVTFRPEFWTGLEAPVISGAMVEKVLHGSLADLAGLSAGAIIVAVDGRRIDSAQQLQHHLAAKDSVLPFTLLAYQGRELQRHRFGIDEQIEIPGVTGTPDTETLPAPESKAIPPLAPSQAGDNEAGDSPVPPLVQPLAPPRLDRTAIEMEVEQVQQKIDAQLRELARLEMRLRQLQRQLED